jgi:phosphatidylglycerol phospholipase C
MLIVLEQSPLLTCDFPFIGLIREKNWHGTGGMKHVRTIKEPKQPIPTFVETLDLLMKVSGATNGHIFVSRSRNFSP